MASSSTTTKMSFKLLVDTKIERVLFAEASKNFIDFLFSFHCLPIGAVTTLLTKNDMMGCLGKLYESIENLSDTYLLHPNQDKDMLLMPRTSIPGFPLLTDYEGNKEEEYEPPKLYMCPERYESWYNVANCGNVTLVKNTPCSNCGNPMSNDVTYVGKKEPEVKGSSGEDGFVKEVVTYMVMDDLVVQPMSTISCIALLNKFHIKDVSSLQEMVVELGIQEGIELLKASLQSNNALTSVFLKNIKCKEEANMILH